MTPAQSRAADCLRNGGTQPEAARAAGLKNDNARTIRRWLELPDFREAATPPVQDLPGPDDDLEDISDARLDAIIRDKNSRTADYVAAIKLRDERLARRRSPDSPAGPQVLSVYFGPRPPQEGDIDSATGELLPFCKCKTCEAHRVNPTVAYVPDAPEPTPVF